MNAKCCMQVLDVAGLGNIQAEINVKVIVKVYATCAMCVSQKKKTVELS